MSGTSGKPGAPAKGAEKGAESHNVQHSAPGNASLAARPDVLLRLNKLIASPGGLNAFLSTFNYTLYLVAYVDTKSGPVKSKINGLLGRAVSQPVAATGPPSVVALAALIGSARTVLRLFGLVPIYAWMRQLLQGPKPGQDTVLWATALVQCTLYGIFQFLENVALLADNGVIKKQSLARWNPTGDTARIKLASYRAWFGGVLCDFVRLGREAQLERARRARRTDAEAKSIEAFDGDPKIDAKWWSEMVVPMAWFPLALHCSLEKGMPGFNLGILGATGFVAGLSRTRALWAATAA